MVPEKALIRSMVERIEAELPCNKTNSSIKFDFPEYIDTFTSHNGKSTVPPTLALSSREGSHRELVETLVSLSVYRLSTIAEALTEALERIPIAKNDISVSFNDQDTPIEILNSQYFLVCILSACLQQWRYSHQGQMTDHPDILTTCTNRTGHSQSKESIDGSGVALEDRIAHRILASISPFLRQPPRTATAINREIDHRVLLHGIRLNPSESLFTETYNCATVSEHYTAESLLLTRLYTVACRVAFYISIGNWCATYSRIKTRLEILSYQPNKTDFVPQVGEVQLMECAAMNKERLNKMLYVVQHTLPYMKQTVQRIVCIIAYRAIWGWIEAFDGEFTQLYKDKGRVDGSPEILFALCRDSTMRKDRELLWPFQTALLLISPGLLNEVARYDVVKARRTSCHPSVLEFVRKLEKMMVSGDKRGEDIAAVCVLDICRAASFLGSESTLSVLHQMVLTAKNDLKERLFDLNRPLEIDKVKVIIPSNEQYGSLTQEQRGGTMIDVHCLLVDALTTLYRLNPRSAIYSIFPMCIHKSAPTIYKSSLVKALRILIMYFKEERENDTASPWHIGTPSFYEAITEPLRSLFIHYVSSVSINERVASTATKISSASYENHNRGDVKPLTSVNTSLTVNERLHMIWELLRLYITDLKLVLGGETSNKTEQTLRVLDSIIKCMRQPSKSINILATECLRSIHTVDYIHLWGEPERYMTAFWTISSHVILSLGKDLLSIRSTQPVEAIECFSTVQKVLSESVIFLKSKDQATILNEWDASSYLQGLITLEVSLLIWTCAPNEDILRANLSCIQEMCKELAYLFVDNEESKKVSSMALHVLLENYPVYLELSKLGQGPATGRRASQKRIWRLLRMLPHDSPGTLVAWKEVWKRWKLLTRVLGATTVPLSTTTSGEQPGVKSPRSVGSSGSSGTTSPMSAPSNSTMDRQRLAHHIESLPRASSPSGQKSDNANTSGVKSQWGDTNRYTLWHNYTGFLASLAGTCLGKTSGSINDDKGDEDDFYTSAESDSSLLVTEFIQHLVGLLSCKDVIVREKIKDILSKELSPAVRIMLLEQLEHTLSNCVSSSMSFTCLILVEQTSVILSSFLENLSDEPTTSAAVSSQMFASLIDQCATYLLCKPGGTTGVGNEISRIRLRFAHLCEILMTARDSTTWTMLHSEFSLRTKLLSTIIEWTSTFRATVHGDQSDRSNASAPPGIIDKGHYVSPGLLTKDDDIERELEVACMRAMMVILDGLPLQPKMSNAFEPDQEDYLQAKSRIFVKYFSYFVQILQQCVSALDDPSKLFLRSSKTSSSDGAMSNSGGSQQMSSLPSFMRTMHSPTSPRYLRSSTEEGSIDRALDIKSCAIHAIANLVSANMDVGLSQALQMMYDENVNIRSALVEAFTIILLKDAQFESLSETIHLDRYERLVDILTDESNDFSFAQLLCDSCSASKMDITARCLIQCFSSKKKIVKFLKIMIEKEIRNTDNEAELLRGTTITTRLLSYLAERVGTEYIQRTLHPVFLKLSKQELPKESSYELNPSRFKKREDMAQNMANVSYAADLILDAICASAEYAPRAIREICHCISVCANARFPEAKYKSVGAFIFLRFFCPAIVSPESTHFRVKISAALYRGLLIAGKISQNLANNVLFGDKESYMFPLNDLLTRNIYRVTRFLREMSRKPPSTSEADAENEFAGEPLNSSDYTLLHNVLFDTIHTMTRRLYAKDIPVRYATTAVNHSILANMILRGQIECISNLLAHLGNPPDMSKKRSSDFCLRGRPLDYANQEYIDFMRRNSDRYVDDIMAKKIIYEAGTSKVGRPVLYVIFRRINSQETDFESMLYLLLRTMELLSVEPFEIVMDFTMYNIDANSSPDRKWFFRLVHLTPYEIYNKIACVYGYNPNVELCKFMRQDLPKPTKMFFSKIQFVVSETELHRYIHPKELHLPETEAELNTAPLVTVYNSFRHYSSHQKVTPVVLKLTHRYIQVTTVKRQKLFGSLSAYLNDVFAISDIDDIFLGSVSSDGSHEIRFRVKRSQTVMKFSSTSNNDAAQFVFIIKRLKSREEDEPISPMLENKLALAITSIRPQEVPGILLNMIFVNLANPNQELRLNSYNLLCALARSFDFSLENQFIETKGICIPKNDVRWIVGISTKLALSQPELTIDLCREWFSGYEKSDEAIQRVCIDYIGPWLSNLSRIYAEGSTDTHIATRTLEIVTMLLELTVRSKAAIRDILVEKIWKLIGESTTEGGVFVDMVITEIIDYAYEHGGIGSVQTEIMTDIMVSMFNTAVWAKLQARVHSTLLRTSFSWTYHLVNHPCWRRSLSIITRFMLMGSFHYRGPIRNWAPEFTHTIAITAGIGTTLERETVHSLMVNGATSLFVPEKANKARVSQFYDDLRVSTSAKTRLLFGLTKSYTTPFIATLETTTDAIDSVGLYSVEQIVKHLIEGLEIMAPSSDILNAWKARWLSLASSLAFQFNPAIQPRALIEIGCLAQDAPDDDLIFQILNVLQRALADGLFELVLGAIMCLRNIVSGLDESSTYILPIFWIALALVQVDETTLFTASVELLSSVLRTLQERRMIGTNLSISQRLLSARHGQIVQEYDRELGVNFEKHFSFAIATILLKHGLSDTEMFQAVRSTLEDFLAPEINLSDTPGIPTTALGYAAALLPDIISDGKLLERAGIMDTSNIISKLNIPDSTSQLLFITILTIQLMSHDKPRKAKIYEFLNEAAQTMPDTFSIVYDVIVPKMNRALMNSSDLEFFDRIESLLITACSSFPIDSADRTKRKYRAALQEAGFTALIDLQSPRKKDVMGSASLASRLVKHIIS
ncbi:hypothetical protein BJV82DRAFT_714889 [Fennellomyces sp. T-0311]|nr:hypothetical protein BJV82DRAFT_714889 [Fennellomyces sp. T-0311]